MLLNDILIKVIFFYLFDFMFFLFYFLGFIVIFLMNYMSYRKVAFFGAVFSFVGLIVMFFVLNFVYMYGFYGVLLGNKKKEVYIIKY